MRACDPRYCRLQFRLIERISANRYPIPRPHLVAHFHAYGFADVGSVPDPIIANVSGNRQFASATRNHIGERLYRHVYGEHQYVRYDRRPRGDGPLYHHAASYGRVPVHVYRFGRTKRCAEYLDHDNNRRGLVTMNAQRQSQVTKIRIAVCTLTLSALTACGGGHASTLPAVLSQNRGIGSSPAQAVAFRVTIPHTITSSSHGRQVRYVSAATKSITISEQLATGGVAVSTTSNCSTSVCTGTLLAPLGMGTFTIGLFDGSNGAGNLLSKGAKTQTIVPNVNNIVAVTFDPVVASLAVNVQPTALEIGAPSVSFVQVIAKDAAGNTIVGPGSFPTPITLASSDASGAITLKANTITDIGQTVEVAYNGATIANPTFTATLPGLLTSAPASLALVANLKSLNGDFTGDIPDSAAQLDGIPFDDQANATESILRSARSRGRHTADFGQPGGTLNLPTKVDLSPLMSPVLNQGQQGSCGAFSLAYAILSYQQKLVRGWSYFLADGVTPDPTHLFSSAFLYNSVNGGGDNGSTLTGNLAFEATSGNASLADMPYNPADFLTQPSAGARQNALGFRITQYARIDPKNVAAVKAQLAAGNAVYWAMLVDNNFQALTGMQVWKGPLQPGAGGHAMALAGYDDTLNAFIIRNSWGTDWGNNGYGYIDYAAFSQYAMDAFVLKVADLTNPNVPNPLPTPQIAATGWDPNNNGPAGIGFQMSGTLNVSPINASNVQVNVAVYYTNADGSLGGRVPATSSQYSDGAGHAATGTGITPVPATGLQSTWSASMPYSALGVQPGQSIGMYADYGLLLDAVEYPLAGSGYSFTVTNNGGVLSAQSAQRASLGKRAGANNPVR